MKHKGRLLSCALFLSIPAAALPRKAPLAFEKTLRLQVLLDRAHFSPGEIDGQAGASLRSAVSAYKRLRLSNPAASDADVDAALLANDNAPILVPYRITDADVAGPFVKIPADMMEQAKLPALGYSSVVEALGENAHASPALLRKLNPGKAFTGGEEIQVPNALRAVVGRAAKIVVSVTDGSVTALDARNETLARYPATLGSERDPLPLGQWKINGVKRDPPFAYNPALFWDAKPEHAKATLPPGPNSPVGVVWIDLSKESMGIHGTPFPEIVGKRQSHGCIRLTNWDASELASMVSPGTPAILTR